MKYHLTKILTILCVCFASYSYGRTTSLSFQHFPYIDQLPSNSINRLYNDKEGYMWFGSKDGLCRFDGYSIKIFRSSSTNPNRFTNNSIQTIAEDDNNRIWIGTLAGVNIIDKKNYRIQPLNNQYVGRDKVNSIIKDKQGSMWVGTGNNGLIRIYPDGSSIRFGANVKGRYHIAGNSIMKMYEDSKGRIWAMINNQGISLFHPEKLQFEQFPPFPGMGDPFNMIEDYPDHFLICTWGEGMYSMDLKRLPGNPFKQISVIQNGKRIAFPDISYSLLRDKKFGYVWVVTFTGLVVMEKKDDNTYNIVHSDDLFPEPYYKLFHEIVQDNKGNLWLGSIGDGIFTLNFNNMSIQTNPLTNIKVETGSIPIVIGLCETADGYMYTALNRCGLYVLNPQTGKISKARIPMIETIKSISTIKHLKRHHQIWICEEGNPMIYILSDKQQSLAPGTIKLPVKSTTITNLFEDSYGNVWIGTDNGLYCKSMVDNVIKLVRAIPNITAINEDNKRNIWVGSDKQGVVKFQRDSRGSIVKVVSFNISAGNLPNNSIQTICCQRNGNVSLGTRVGSIYFYDERNNSMHDVSKQYGITEEAVFDILEDNAGALWISTIKKIIRFNPASHTTTYYTQSDGVMVTSFRQNAAVKLSNGTMLFGGNNGLCSFAPNAISTTNRMKPKVVITDIQVKNQSIFEAENDKQYEAEDNALVLKNTDDDVSLEFSALNFTAADKIQYAYRLIGVSKDWIYIGNNRHFVNYANLAPGRYTFEVKATDENGQWGNQITSLVIIKKPPFYQTWWAYLFYLIIAGGIVWFLFNRVRLRNELRISRIEKEKSEELAQTKLRYFTNISHDLLTPLTIISLLTDELQSKSASDKNQIELIRNNVNRLRRLIKQILAFRKIDTGNMKLKVKKGDIVSFVREVCYTNFQPLIKEKNISFAVEAPFDNFIAWFDPDKLDKVLYNLLSNAFKFTPSGGSIIVKLNFPTQEGLTFLQLAVSDTGEGIHEKDLPHIFSRFYISNSSDQSQSNGIGLSLVRDLLQIHKGEINVVSKLHVGTTFTFEIPVSEDAFDQEEFATEDTEVSPQTPAYEESVDVNEVATMVQPEHASYNILVVEDNKELNQIIVDHLCDRFTVHSATNGLHALNIIKEYSIDLIISDVMMPEMDGLTLCRTLKSDLATSHIDILLLTAKSSADDQVDYFNAGADAYMPKPFDLKVLAARVNNLVNRRRQNVMDFRKNKEVNISAMHYGSLDEEFMKKAVLVVEQHMSDFNFDFDRFAETMNSSKSTLHRKLKALTDLSPGEFIRNVRLKHACEMLVSTNDPISEIAYALGFNNPKYFSSCFKSEFEMTPREYRDSHQTA
ncbi:hybrid sensor histidine kinase/response regulator transcription factor [Paludibacter sp.]|uniref:hybrid sensor histidine kinase/response regulator transcription factor n=1 Tax=Paludibacter sp. TaxID=1898105 RepID=UPI0025EFE02A|nr:hybrid sensor histidine kinase/response regulator transcription factor [Paludibacter sp.]